MAIVSYADEYKKYRKEQVRKLAESDADVGTTRQYTLKSESDPATDIVKGALMLDPLMISEGISKATGNDYSDFQKGAAVYMFVPSKLSRGFFGAAEGITDFLAGGAAQLVGQKDAAKWIYQHSWTSEIASDDLVDREIGNDSTGYKVAGDILNGIGNVAFQIVLAYLTAGIGNTIGGASWAASAAGQATMKGITYGSLFASAAGSGTAEAVQKTGDLGWRENVSGVLKGGVEVATEMISPTGKVIKGVIKGKTAEEGIKYIGKHALAKEIVKNFAEEALEESLSYAGGWYIDNKITKIDNEPFSWKEFFYEGAIGGIAGSLFSTPFDIHNVRVAQSTGKKIYAQGEAYANDKINEGLVVVKELREKGHNSDALRTAEKALMELKTNEKLTLRQKQLYLGLAETTVLHENLVEYAKNVSESIAEKVKNGEINGEELANSLNAVINEAGGEGKYTAADFSDKDSAAVRMYAFTTMASDFLSPIPGEGEARAFVNDAYNAQEYTGSEKQKQAIRDLQDGQKVIFKVGKKQNEGVYGIIMRVGDQYSAGFTTSNQVANDGTVYATHKLSLADAETFFDGDKRASADEIDAAISIVAENKAKAQQAQREQAQAQGQASQQEMQKPAQEDAGNSQEADNDGVSRSPKKQTESNKKAKSAKAKSSDLVKKLLSEHFVFEKDGLYGTVGKNAEAVIDQYFRKLTAVKGENRRGVANAIADYLIDNVTLQDAYGDNVKTDNAETLNTLRSYMHRIDLSGIQGEINYKYGKNSGLNAVWGAPKTAKGIAITPDLLGVELEQYGIHLKGENEADLFFQLVDLYRSTKKLVDEGGAKISVYDFMSEEESAELRDKIADEIMDAYEKTSMNVGGEETKKKTAKKENAGQKRVSPLDLSEVERDMMPKLDISREDFTAEEWTQAREAVPHIDALDRVQQADILTLVRSGNANGVNADYIRGLCRVAAAFNMGIRFSAQIKSNGFLVRSERMILINPASVDNTIGHEIWHTIDTNDKGEFRQELIDKVKKIVGEKAFDKAKADYKAAYEQQFGKEITAEELDGEATAKVVGDYLSSLTILKRIAHNNPGVCSTILAAVRRMKNKWRTAKVFAAQNNSTTFAEYRKMTRIEKLLVEELNKAKNAKQTGTEAPFGENISYSPAGDTSSAAFKRWFGNSPFKNEDGTPKVYYHGAKKGGGFTVFRDWQYFTDKKQYAERYADRDNSNALYKVYLTADKVFDTRNADARKIFQSIRNEYGLSELQDTGLPDWTDGYDITEYLSEHQELGYDAVILDEGGDLVDGEPVSRGESIIIKDSAQVKSATDNIGTYDRANPDIRYSPATAEADARYAELAKEPKKNDSVLREMVKQAAKAAGFDSPLLYHGTGAFGFTTFDLSKMDDRRTIFLTDSEEIASTYSGSKGIRGVSGKANIPDNVDAVYIATELNNNLPAQEQDNGYYYTAYSRKALSNLEKQNRIDLAKLKLFLKEKGYKYGEESSWSHKFSATIGQLTVELNKPYNSKKNNLSTPIYILANNTDLFGGFDVEINGNYGLESRIRLAMRLSEFFSNNAETNTVKDSVVAKVGMDGYDVEVYSYDDARALLEENYGRGNYGLYANLDNTIEINGDGRNWNTLLYQADVSRFYEPIQGAHGYRIYNTFTNETFYLADTESGEFATKEEAQKRIDGMVNGYKYRIARLKTTREVSRWAQAMGYSGVVLRNITDNGGQNISVKIGEKANIFMFFDPSSIKSADPVTYDDFGNIIPLSERFNPQNDDIRYSPLSASDRVVLRARKPRETLIERYKNGELNRTAFRKAVDNMIESAKVLTVNAQQAVENQLVRGGMSKRQAGAVTQFARSARTHGFNAVSIALADMTGEVRARGLLPILEPFLATKGEVCEGYDEKTGQKVTYVAQGGELAGKRFKDFSTYYSTLNAIERAAVGKNPYSSVSVDQMKADVAEFEKKNPDFKAAADELVKFNSVMLDIRVQSGLISQELADKLRERYPHYVPMRPMESNSVGKGAAKGSNNLEVNRGLRTATESDHRTYDPFANYIAQIESTIKAAKLNMMLNEVYNSADGVSYEQVGDKKVWSVRYLEIGKDGKEQFVEIGGFKSQKEAQTEYLKHQDSRVNKNVVRGDIEGFETKQLREQERAYLDDPDAMPDPSEMFRKFKDEHDNVRNEVTFYKDGKLVTMGVTDRIYTGISDLAGIRSTEMNFWIVNASKKINDTFKKLVTNWNPFFGIKNIARDLQDGSLQTQHGLFEFLNEYRKNAQMMASGKYNDMWTEFLANGGLESSLFSDEQGQYAKRGKSSLEKAEGVAGAFQHIKNFNTLTEALPRFTEYCLTRKHGGSVQTALLNAADVTVNFGRSGTLTRVLNSTVSPFLNPAVQGMDRVIRLFTENGIKNNKALASLLVKAVLLAIIPMALSNAMYGGDEEYEDMKDNIKENNYLFKVGDTWLKLPRGRVVSTIAGLYNRSSKQLMGKEVDWKDYGKNVLDQITPAQNVARHIASPFVDVANNKTWYGSAIESQSLQNYAVKDRYDENTSRISVWIGQFTSHFGLSPKKVNYLLDQYTGVIGDILLPTTTPAGTKGVVSYNFTVDPNTSSNLSTRFYKLYDETMYASNGGDVEAYYLKKRLDETKSAASELFKQIKTINADSSLSNKEKVKQASAIRAMINQLYKTALQDAKGYSANIKDAMAIENSYAVEQITQKNAKQYGLTSSDAGKYAVTFGGQVVKLYGNESEANEYSASSVKKTVYAEANRLTYGSEYALKEYSSTVYEKAQKLNELGISYDEYYNYYMNVRYYSGADKKQKILAYLKGSGLSKSQVALMMYYSGYTAYADEAKKAIKASSLSAERKKELLAGITN